MVASPAYPLPLAALPQYRSYPPAYPTVQPRKCPLVAVLEVFKPPSARHIHGFDDPFQTLPVSATGLFSNGILHLLDAFLSRPSGAPLKVVS